MPVSKRTLYTPQHAVEILLEMGQTVRPSNFNRAVILSITYSYLIFLVPADIPDTWVCPNCSAGGGGEKVIHEKEKGCVSKADFELANNVSPLFFFKDIF